MLSASSANYSLMHANLSAFIGQWVALDNGKVVAHSKDLKSVYSEVKNPGNVLFAKVPGNEISIF